ncbi:NeuD/PglB/VioB family sugar acetyltransferase [Parabacteroides goldsteinii]|uniref:NeuD/PglB/VioB family sugar acetyltransferase n=1 Tax=Parabacteroides goldsteinii TaxID=328812 RepID=UPI0032C14D86
MKDLIIVGAGGMGRSVYNTALQCCGCGKDYKIKGFIDDDLNALNQYVGYPPIVGKISDYCIHENEIFISALGNVISKKKCIESLLERGAEFITLVHPTTLINCNAQLGKGCLVDSFSVIGADTTIGDFVVIGVGTVVGHDVEIGNWSRIDGNVTLVGGVKLGEEVCVHTGAIINHKVSLGDRSCVGAGSFVIRKVQAGTTVFGNPAKRFI